MPLQLKLSEKFYDQPSLQKAIEDYRDFGRINYKSQGGFFVIDFKNIDPDVKSLIIDEFANYVLGQTVKAK